MQAPAQRYIAIRPIDAAPEANGAGPDDPDRLDAIRSGLLSQARPLDGVGLEASAGLADIPRDPARGGYVTLPELNALVIEPPAGTTEEALRRALPDDYAVAPDFGLSHPETALGTPVEPAEVLPTAKVLPAHTGVQESHDEGNRGAGVVVAILDTGCDAGHREFANRGIDFAAVPQDDSPVRQVLAFDAGTHGTHVTGTVAGAVVGIAPEVDLINASVMESDTYRATAIRVLKALYWLIDRLKDDRYGDKPVILNMSLGFLPADFADDKLLAQTLLALRRVIQQVVVERGILPVVAIGNSGPKTACAPGFYPESLSVGAVDYGGKSWPRSSGGAGAPGFELECNPDVAGYGVDVVSAVGRGPDGESRYERKSGTSMAAPYVTGVAALVAARTGLRGLELRTHLLDNALDLGLQAERGGRGLVRYLV